MRLVVDCQSVSSGSLVAGNGVTVTGLLANCLKADETRTTELASVQAKAWASGEAPTLAAAASTAEQSWNT